MPSPNDRPESPAFVGAVEDRSLHARLGVLLAFRSLPRRVRWGRVPGSKMSVYDWAPVFEDLNQGIESKPSDWRVCLRRRQKMDFEPDMILASIEVAGYGWDGSRCIFRRWWKSNDGPLPDLHNPPMSSAWEVGTAADFLEREVPALARQLFAAESPSDWPALTLAAYAGTAAETVQRFRSEYPSQTIRRAS